MQFFSEKLMDHVSSKLYIGGVNQHLCQLSVNILVTISVVGVYIYISQVSFYRYSSIGRVSVNDSRLR